MRALRVLIAIVPVFVLGCASSSPMKASNSAFLVGEGDGKTTEKTMLGDLGRNVQLKMKRDYTEAEKKDMQNTKGYAESKTDTTMQIYPYTKPLLKARITKNINETAFKENWDKAKIQPEIDKQYAAEVKRLVTDHQCFGVEIDSNDPEAARLEYWYGNVEQDGKTQKLTFTKGSGYSQKGLWVDRSAMPKLTKVYQYADACVPSKLNLLGDIKLTVEPRFRHDILPINLAWMAPADAATVAASQPTTAPAPKKK